MEEVQGTAACLFILPLLLQDPRSCVQLMRLDAACKRDLALDKTRPPAFTMQRRAMIRQICNVESNDVATVRLKEQLEIHGLNVFLRK